MIVKFKKLHPDAVAPQQARPGDAGFDLVAVSFSTTDFFVEYDTGIAIEIPEGHVGLLFPRSSISKTDLTLANSVGVVDSSYRGSLRLRFKGTVDTLRNQMVGEESVVYPIGDRIGQLVVMPIPAVEFVEADVLSDTARGDGGFGSTGQ